MPKLPKDRPPQTRPSLLIRLRNADDADAWDQFVELYAPLLYGFFRSRGLQDADAADVTQDVFHGVSFGVERFHYDPQRGTFRSWLYAIARNKLNDFLAARQRQTEARGDSTALELLHELPAADIDAERWEREYNERVFAWAAECVQRQVDENTWQAFWRAAVLGESGQAVADALQMSVGAVYVAKSRVIKRLKLKVEEIEGETT
ncbi:MAG: sigma-70 family RNA polymerase sigma factor [Planctomycetaceae bacterium]|nr:sigma-70 family RNA polymerase sigma factor [Planctomycetaceae bacterium]